MTQLTKFSLRNPIAILIIVLLIAIGGVYSTTKLNQEMMPDVTPAAIYVNVVWPGASSQEVMNTVTKPLERSLQNVEGVQKVNSSSSDSVSFIRLEFDQGADRDLKKSKVEEAIANVTLPQNAMTPNIIKGGSSTVPILFAAVVPKGSLSADEFQAEVRDHVIPDMKSVSGVGGIEATGLNATKIMISVDPEKLKSQKVTYQQVTQVLQGQNVNAPLGVVTLNKMNETVTLNGALASLDQISNLSLSPNLRLKDVASVQKVESTETVTTVDNKPGVGISLMKNIDANTVKVVADLKDMMAQNSKVELKVIYDSSEAISESVFSMAREGGLGAVFAALLILLFLRNFRATVISVVSIPLSILITLIMLQQFHIALNLMSLAGMIVATGRVVDDSIVVIENIMRRLQNEKMSYELILDSLREVVKAITSSTLTTVAVFAPLGLVSGLIGIVFGPFAITVVLCLIASLIVSITVVPMLAYLMMRKYGSSNHGDHQGTMAKRYKKALEWSLNHKAIVLILSFVVLGGSIPLGMSAGFTFLPSEQNKVVGLTLTLPRGTDLTEVHNAAKNIDEKLRADSRSETVEMVVGTPKGQGKEATVTNVTNWYVLLKPNTDIVKYIDEKKSELKPNREFTTLELFQVPNAANGADVQIIVNGPNKESIKKAAEKITEIVKGVEGTENVKNNLQEGLKGVEIKVRHDDALLHGLTSGQASQMIRPYLTEQKIGTISNGSKQDDLFMQLTPVNGIQSLDVIANLELVDPTGKLFKVKDIADVQEVEQPGALQLQNGNEYASVSAGIISDDKSSTSSKIKDALKGVTLENGASYSLGGANQQIANMVKDMIIAFIIAIGAVYIVLVVTFGEGKAPFAILFSIPFAIIGSMIGIKLSGQPISLPSMIGFLMLIGIVVTNAIVLLDRANQNLEKGVSIREALVNAGGVRLRPILMTAIATMFAILPLTLGLGSSMVISQGLAVVVMGGLISSTFLTLFIVPIMFEILHRKRVKVERQGKKWNNSLQA
ncbi:efflux RND transporter permease subunit [Tumebacillus permanentifrigoris]|uniref:HAE1 family hydrophobic/amphiphilic exporter-1 n=1 Tax=Tumebacillus permanentifrigoris TaxID=378543 RepID=A0A316DZ57_9BACL|nr:efflux RND transporter permease subunit [Tumebacillus permanentifrigoris]PWK15790.1 HAE1 family hydrophobic/amphiphilic exporter-1 [Tumebacillus permanentifrigoris]